MLDLLRPFFPGDWARYGESLQLSACDAGPSIAQWLADPAHLDAALTLHARSLHADRHSRLTAAAVASAWLLNYLTVLLPALVALCSLLKYRVPASLQNLAMHLDESGTPYSFTIPELGIAATQHGATCRYESLIWEHLEPLIERIAQQTRAPVKVLRGNVRRVLLGIFEHASTIASAQPALHAALLEDQRELLETPTWPDGRRNPLFFRHRRVSMRHVDGDRLLTLHANCCLLYQLPDVAYCEACPIAPEYRNRGTRVEATQHRSH